MYQYIVKVDNSDCFIIRSTVCVPYPSFTFRPKKPTPPEIPTEQPSPDRRETQVPVMREKVDLLAQKLVRIKHEQDNRLFPMLHVDKDFIDELSVPWKDALIVKLSGNECGFDGMKRNLDGQWGLAGEFDLLDIGNGFFVVKFNSEEDKTKVIKGIPWDIYGHHLLIRQWTQTFNAKTETIEKTMSWVRIVSLNLVYHDESFLWAIASAIGIPIEVILDALRVERGRFARVCVEIDMNKPVVRSVGINGEWYEVQYEGLCVCQHCSCYGHCLRDCTYRPS
ncbi:uncharacterized protein LOC123914775 [Trifolium pratense]|uniref:uncharacterized protein LOC123914775 n=1 Tax=Trifolium pratense TaxID=57577 RepID=UPI001E69604A|nr:uncharacterized protein LOC123914775 [Trifolium pratense]